MSRGVSRLLAQAAAPSGGRRLPSLDGLRAVAILGVLVAHLPMSYPQLRSRLLGFGGVGVDLFFGLSAFLLYYPVLTSGRAPDPLAFYRRRFCRIVPAYLVAVAATIVAIPHVREAPARAIIANILLIQTLRAEWSKAVIAAAWFLPPLVHFYVVFPFIAWLGLQRPKALLLGLLGVGLLAQTTVFRHLLPPRFPIHQNLPYLTLPFLAGMVAAYLSLQPLPVYRYFAVIGIAYLVPHAAVVRPLIPELTGEYARLLLGMRGLLVSASCCLTMLGLATAPNAALSRMLSMAPVRALGLVSYGAFLFHYPLRWVLFVHLSKSAATWLMIPLSIVAGVLSYVYIEAPVMRLARHRPSRTPACPSRVRGDNGT